ncbi:MAG: hypothetical protein QE263_04175 [Vampirovibrionales bacterium]|nr:hypothetical protein [Vampirovibrionales bacterium]
MTTPTAPQPDATLEEAKPAVKPLLRPMEKAMLGMTVFYLVGIVIFGNVTPGPIRGYTMTAYCFAFVWFFLKPFGLVDKIRGSR